MGYVKILCDFFNLIVKKKIIWQHKASSTFHFDNALNPITV